MTIRETRTILAYWRELFTLLDWTITVRWETGNELGGLPATIEWDSTDFWAKITLSRKPSDKEHDIVHELLHLILDDDRKTLERKFNRIVNTLLKLKRS